MATVLYSVIAVGLLTWVQVSAASAPQPGGPVHVVARLVPGGLTTIGLAWVTAFALTSLVALVRGASRPALLVMLVAFVGAIGFLEAWTRAAALPTQGGISSADLWLYAGSRWAFLGAGVLVIAAAAIRWERS